MVRGFLTQHGVMVGGDTAVNVHDDIIATTWKITTSYKEGDYVMHNGSLYVCQIDNVGQEPLRSGTSYWMFTRVAEDLQSVKNYAYELNGNLARIKVIESVSNDGTGWVTIPYPDGFTSENTVINETMFEISDGRWLQSYYGLANYLACELRNEYICYIPLRDEAKNKKIKISLFRFK